MNLKKWWKNLPPEKRNVINRRVAALRPNVDLVGRRDARYAAGETRGKVNKTSCGT